VAGAAPSIDEIRHHYAGVFLIAPHGRVIGQRRDDIPTIDNPGRVAAFGGTVEDSEEPREAVWRELTQEETNLHIRPDDLCDLISDVAWRKLTSEWEVRHFFYVAITDTQLQGLEVFEGAGWAYIESPEDPHLIDSWRPVTRLLFERLAQEPDSP
jgi:8-oxo-dGTP pyrophosphatase MutT (NUDIX family)